ncbi:MAG TPA: ABC transporter permease [Gemmatimonadales bacterium]|nr:ABC transporter permease [Gemmatimonadales bacterium]
MTLRQTLRSLRHRPGFSALVILALGLGIGASTAIFTVVNAVLLKPLPYRDPSRLALVWSKWSNFDKTWVSFAEYLDYQRQTQLFQDVALWNDNGEVTLTGPEGHAESVTSAQATANLLDVLGMPPRAGQMFTAAEDIPNGPAVVMVGYDLWQKRWSGDPALVGKTIQVDGQPYRVSGILPRDFRLPLEFQSRSSVQLIGPMQIDRSAPSRGGHCCYAIGRLQPGATPALVTAEIRTLTAQWVQQGLYPVDMHFQPFSISLNDEVTGAVRPALMLLTAAVVLLLVLTCANVANLMLTRAADRGREMAVRAALGAGLRDMLRLALGESLVLGFAGGAVGLGLAWASVRLLASRAPTTVPRVAELGIDLKVGAFAFLLAAGTGILFALVPFARVRRLDLADSLRAGRGQSAGIDRRRARTALVVCETAFAVLLLIGAGLTIRTFINLLRINPGFDARHVLTMQVSLPAAKYGTVESANTFFHTLGDEVRKLPGVQAAGFSRLLPLATEMGDAGLVIQTKPLPPNEPRRQADWQAVSPGYFEAMKIPLVSGRYFDAHDDYQGEQVIILNRELVKEYFPGEDPLGQMIRIGRQDAPFRRVVGVVGDVHHNGLLGNLKRGFYVPQDQWANSYGPPTSPVPRRSAYLVVRSSGAPEDLTGRVVGLIRGLDADLPATDIRLLSDVLATATQEQRFTMGLMAVFALLALTLAAVGIYGVISYSVSQRTREIGIRLALGSDVRGVRDLVLRQGMRPAYLGVLLGLGGAVVLTRFLQAILYQVAPLDWVTFLFVPFVLLAVAAVAVLIPAVRASRVAPVEALRME